MPSFEHLDQVQDVYSVLESSLHPLHLNISELSVTTQNAMLKNKTTRFAISLMHFKHTVLQECYHFMASLTLHNSDIPKYIIYILKIVQGD